MIDRHFTALPVPVASHCVTAFCYRANDFRFPADDSGDYAGLPFAALYRGMMLIDVSAYIRCRMNIEDDGFDWPLQNALRR